MNDTTGALSSYRAMYRIRQVEQTLLALSQNGEITGSIHLCVGQEAVPVGACSALRPDDPVIATYRGHGWAIARGVPISDLMAEILGRDSSLNGGRGGSAYLSAPQFGFIGENSIVGAGIPAGLGLSLAAKLTKSDRVALVAFGDGAMNQGVVHETLNLASVLAIPLVLVVENNGYAEMTPSDLLTSVNAAGRASGYRAESWDVDGDDPDSVHDAVSQARAAALSRGIPTIVEARTHRLLGHYSGDAQQYRPKGEVDAWRETEPLRRVEADTTLSASLDEIRAQVDAEITTALSQARAVPLPDPTTAQRNVYAH